MCMYITAWKQPAKILDYGKQPPYLGINFINVILKPETCDYFTSFPVNGGKPVNNEVAHSLAFLSESEWFCATTTLFGSNLSPVHKYVIASASILSLQFLTTVYMCSAKYNF